MAIAAQNDQKKRVVEVNREKLVQTLKENRDKHVREYGEAVAGYREQVLGELRAAHENAKRRLDESFGDMQAKYERFEPERISEFPDYLMLVENHSIHLPVPKSYEQEYESAIAMAEWDIRETLELTFSEFECFVRDKWEWTDAFDCVKASYTKIA